MKAPAPGNLSFSDWPLIRNKEMPQGLRQTPSERPGQTTRRAASWRAAWPRGRHFVGGFLWTGRERNYDSYQRGFALAPWRLPPRQFVYSRQPKRTNTPPTTIFTGVGCAGATLAIDAFHCRCGGFRCICSICFCCGRPMGGSTLRVHLCGRGYGVGRLEVVKLTAWRSAFRSARNPLAFTIGEVCQKQVLPSAAPVTATQPSHRSEHVKERRCPLTAWTFIRILHCWLAHSAV